MRWIFVILVFSLVGCGSSADESSASPSEPAPVVRGNAEGFLLTWFDDEGAHIAEAREAIPAERRSRVRVDRLDIAPEDRDPSNVWLADLNDMNANGAYPVESMGRDAFDTLLDEEAGVEFAEAGEDDGSADDGSDIVVYGASWCNACRSAAAYLRSQNVPFVERDIEAEPGARAEMQAKARAAGIQPSGIPVIDVRGTIVTGFDESRIARLLRES
ncbi:MAG: glutaredoxin [Polyangiales bacterium]|jgi:glutaredoxin